MKSPIYLFFLGENSFVPAASAKRQKGGKFGNFYFFLLCSMGIEIQIDFTVCAQAREAEENGILICKRHV